jgi:hypothetical protein
MEEATGYVATPMASPSVHLTVQEDGPARNGGPFHDTGH